MSESTVAPADVAGQPNVNEDGEREALPDGAGEGVHPVVLNPDQPTFPAPMGVPVEKLKEDGVDHAYVGLPQDDSTTTTETDTTVEPTGDGGDGGAGDGSGAGDGGAGSAPGDGEGAPLV